MDTQKPRQPGALYDDYLGNLAPAKSRPKPLTVLHLGPAYIAGKREVGRVCCCAPTHSSSSTKAKRKMEAT